MPLHASLLPTLLALLVPAAPPAECARLVQRTYSVADLVVPLSQAGPAERAGQVPATVEKQLIKLITGTVAPESWQEQGGRGSVQYHEPGLALVVRQTPGVQDQVADLLGALRRLQETQVVLEFKVLSLSEAFFERIGIDFEVNAGKEKDSAPAVQAIRFNVGKEKDSAPAVQVIRAPTWQDLQDRGTLDDREVARLLEAVQGDPRTNVMQSPRVTVFNGIEAVVQVGEERRFVTGYDVDRAGDQAVVKPRQEVVQTGLRLTARPAVTPDGKSVVVQVKASQTDIEPVVPLMPVGPAEGTGEGIKDGQRFVQQPVVRRAGVEDTLTIPNGGTVVLGGLSHVVETRREDSPPVLSKIPYVNRLFKNVGIGRETQQWMVLVTARVVRPEKDEAEETRAAGLRRGYGEVRKLCPGTPLAVLAARATAVPPAATAAGRGAVDLCPNNIIVEMATQALSPAARGASEEQETPAGRGEGSRTERVLAELLRAYDAACAAGRREEAARLAGAALALDPTCFRRGR